MHHFHVPTFTVVAGICFTAARFPREALLSLNEYSPAVVKIPSLASQHGSRGGSNLSNWYFLLRLWWKNSGTRRKHRNKPHFKWSQQNTLLKLWDHVCILAAVGLWSPTTSQWIFSVLIFPLLIQFSSLHSESRKHNFICSYLNPVMCGFLFSVLLMRKKMRSMMVWSFCQM